MKLGELIKAYREQYHLAMQDFADRASLSKGYISMLEKGQHPQNQRKLTPSLQTYKKIASAMNLSLDELLSMLDGNEPVRLVHSLGLSSDENELLTVYRTLNSDGQEKVITYATDLSSSGRYAVSDNIFQYNAVAAHERTDIEVTDEMRQFDDDIMNDENF